MTDLINGIIVFVLISALVVIMSNQIERSVLALIMTFALAGILFIIIGVPFFGFIYLLVYTAAISILFLFVIMMLDIPQDPHRPLSPSVLSGGLFVSLGLLSIFYSLILPLNLYPVSWSQGLNDDKMDRLIYHIEWGITKIETMQSIGYILYSEQVSLLLLIAVILLIVMVGIINHLYTAKTQ